MIYLQLFFEFFKIGLFTFGGGYAMIPLIQDAVIKLGWATNEELINFIAISESTPGPFAINMATFVGIKMAGVFGAVCTTLGVVLPSYIIILIIAKGYQRYKESHIVMGLMSGLKPTVIGLLLGAVITIALTIVNESNTMELIISCGIFLISLAFLLNKKHPIYIVILSGVLGISCGYIFGL